MGVRGQKDFTAGQRREGATVCARCDTKLNSYNRTRYCSVCYAKRMAELTKVSGV